jgi:serine O-acetyltransferase
MIKSKQDYRLYLLADQIARRGCKGMTLRDRIVNLLLPDLVWEFQKRLRKLEYYKNCRKDIFSRLYWMFLYKRYHNLSYKLGFQIFPNSIGPGLKLHHYPQIIIHMDAVLGEDCQIFQGVTIGKDLESIKCPRLGNNVIVGAGAKVLGDIDIADNIFIGANAVVTKSFTEPGISIAGIPAKKVSQTGSLPYANHATEQSLKILK